MRKLPALMLAVVALAFLAGAAGIVSVVRRGLSARDEPTRVEVLIARQLRHLAVPRAARGERNPAERSPEGLARARSHFADHCASCHGNDGRGRTILGQSLYPKGTRHDARGHAAAASRPRPRFPVAPRLLDQAALRALANGVHS